MTEPTIICPSCKVEIKLTESLAAPLLEATRQDFERRTAQKEAGVAKRESSLKEREAALNSEKATLDDRVAEKLKEGRDTIAADEARKAKQAFASDLEQKSREVAELQGVMNQKDLKLAAAQNEQADLIRKRRDLEDEKRALELTVEQQVETKLSAAREEFGQRLNKKDEDVAKRELALQAREGALIQARNSIDEQVAEKVKEERSKIAAEEAGKAKQMFSTEVERKSREVTDLEEIVKQKDLKLAAAQTEQAEMIRKKRELDDEKRELDLTVERRVEDGLSATRDQARREAEEVLNLKVAEKELTITSMKSQIEELKRRSEQGSQQLQGEVQELELETLLSARFPRDTIEPVPKGEHGGDVLHRVLGPVGQICGTILWESKRTKNWSDAWLPKLRDDQRAAKADTAVIVSQVLPRGVDSFDLVDGVWVAHTRVAIPIALILRQSLVELAMARQVNDGQQTKTEMVYQYLTGSRFKQRVQAIVEAFSTMQEDLTSERKAILKQWAKREEQINRVMEATVGMYGDLQGIAGKTLQEIEGLELPALGDGRLAE